MIVTGSPGERTAPDGLKVVNPRDGRDHRYLMIVRQSPGKMQVEYALLRPVRVRKVVGEEEQSHEDTARCVATR